jgi:hypothetical protein
MKINSYFRGLGFIMNKVILVGILWTLPLLLFAQNNGQDSISSPEAIFSNHLTEIPYNQSLLDTVPGFSIAMIPPEHFVYAENIPGYIHPGTTASIQIKEIEGTSWQIIDNAMSPEHFNSQGVKLIKREEVELLSGLSGVLYTVSFNSQGIEYYRLMLFAGDYNQTIWLNANYPVLLQKTVYKPLYNSLMSAEIIQ